MVVRLLCALLFLAAIGSGCGARGPLCEFEAERRATRAYTVGPGDVLEVRCWKNDALSQRVTVRLDGYITLPLIGDVAAGGRTVESIAGDVAQRAGKFYTEPQVVAVEV